MWIVSHAGRLGVTTTDEGDETMPATPLPSFGVRPEQLVTPVTPAARHLAESLRDAALCEVRAQLEVCRIAKDDLKASRHVLQSDWRQLFRAVSELEQLESSINEAVRQFVAGHKLAAPHTLDAAQDHAVRVGMAGLLTELRGLIGGCDAQ